MAISSDVPAARVRAGASGIPSADRVPGALLEREAPLAELRALLGQAEAGSRALVVVRGEAGIGKSALVEACSDAIDTRSRYCEGATTA